MQKIKNDKEGIGYKRYKPIKIDDEQVYKIGEDKLCGKAAFVVQLYEYGYYTLNIVGS
jgi:hypothetical protein